MRKQIIRIMNRLGLKVSDLVSKIGMDRGNLYAMLNGSKSLGSAKSEEILKALGCKVHVVIDEPFNQEVAQATLKLEKYNELWTGWHRLWYEENALARTKKHHRGLPKYPTFSNFINEYIADGFELYEDEEDGWMLKYRSVRMQVRLAEKKMYDTWNTLYEF